MTQKIAYLTIDDVPSEDFRSKVDFLLEKGIPAIFFCEGQKLSKFEDDIIFAIKNGFIIGSHSWSHQNFNDLSQDEIKIEITKTDDLIDEIYKKANVERKIKLFRFPFLKKGESNKEFAQSILKDLGYRQPSFDNINYEWYKKEGFHKDLDVVCTYDSMDWTVSDGSHMFDIKNLQDLFNRMDENIPEGRRGLNFEQSSDIIMMHDDPRIKEMFKPLIERFLEKGIQFKLPSF
ncbi:MAG: polysaccharide deacetylase family protein [archaeon]